jgi:polyisoprenoid-binding protein YceI
LSDGDKRKIEGQIVTDVLAAERYPQIVFTSTSVTRAGSGFLVQGTLDLHGQHKEFSVTTTATEGRQVADVTLHQPEFGIKPYTAMLGTLRVRADLRVRLSVPWSQ